MANIPGVLAPGVTTSRRRQRTTAAHLFISVPSRSTKQGDNATTIHATTVSIAASNFPHASPNGTWSTKWSYGL